MRSLIEFPRWLFLAILVFAPWAYGCIPGWSIVVLDVASAGILVVWILGCVARRAKPKVGLIPLASVGFLLCQGWGMILNAHYAYDRSKLEFRPLDSGWRLAPGAVDIVDSIPVMVRLTGLLGIFCFACDLMQRPHWRRRVGWTIGATGISIVLYGLAERIAGVQRWSAGGDQIDTFFSTYLYNANAGAFINLVLPLIVGSAVVTLSLKKATSRAQPSCWA